MGIAPQELLQALQQLTDEMAKVGATRNGQGVWVSSRRMFVWFPHSPLKKEHDPIIYIYTSYDIYGNGLKHVETHQSQIVKPEYMPHEFGEPWAHRSPTRNDLPLN